MLEGIERLIRNNNTKIDLNNLSIDYNFHSNTNCHYIGIANIINEINILSDLELRQSQSDIIGLIIDLMLQKIERNIKNQYYQLIEKSEYTLYEYNVCLDNNLDENTIICHPKFLNEILRRTPPWRLPGRY